MNNTTSSDGDSSVEFLPWESRNKCKYDDFNINLAALANPNKPKKVGDIGFTFTKYFPGHGNFEGTVVEIRDGAEDGRDRRCRYKDGDVEDLSLDDLIQLNDLMKAGDRKSKPAGAFRYMHISEDLSDGELFSSSSDDDSVSSTTITVERPSNNKSTNDTKNNIGISTSRKRSLSECITEDQLVPTSTNNEGIVITGNASNKPVSGPTRVSRDQERSTKDTDDRAPAFIGKTKKRRIDNVDRGTALLPTPVQLPRESTKTSNSSSIFNCPICLEKFEPDITAVRDKRQSKLPIMSASCAHKVCAECLVDMQLSWSAGSFQSLPKWLKCPVCKQKIAFNALDMPVDSFACECIMLCTSNGAKEAEPTSATSSEIKDLNLKIRDLEGKLKSSSWRSLNSTNEAVINALNQQLREKDEEIANLMKQNLSLRFSKSALEDRCKTLESEKARKDREIQELIEQQKKDTQILNSLVDLNNEVTAKLRNEAQKETDVEAAEA